MSLKGAFHILRLWLRHFHCNLWVVLDSVSPFMWCNRHKYVITVYRSHSLRLRHHPQGSQFSGLTKFHDFSRVFKSKFPGIFCIILKWFPSCFDNKSTNLPIFIWTKNWPFQLYSKLIKLPAYFSNLVDLGEELLVPTQFFSRFHIIIFPFLLKFPGFPGRVGNLHPNRNRGCRTVWTRHYAHLVFGHLPFMVNTPAPHTNWP